MTVDLTPRIHELLVRDLSLPDFMSHLLIEHEEAYPQYDWAPLKALPLEESDELLERWLVPAFKREPPRAKRVKALWCGLFLPIRNDETLADMYIAGTQDFEIDQAPCSWNVRPAYWPMLRYASSGWLADMYRCAYREGGPGGDADTYLAVGYAAKTMSTLLGRVDAKLILGSRKEVQVAVGWDAGDPLYIGHLGKAGFVPRPVAAAVAGLRLQATRLEAHRRERARKEAESLRCFRHPDGRVWTINATDEWITLRYTDTDGDEHSRNQFRYWPSDDLTAIAAELVNEQLSDGFVEEPCSSGSPMDGRVGR